MIPDDGRAPEVSDAPAELHVALTTVLRWASRPSVVRRLAGPSAEGLSPTDLWLLDGIARYGPVRASEIAVWQGVDRSTITTQLRRLSDRGLIDRGPDPRDARAMLVSASAAGERMRDEVGRQGAGVLAGLLADWSPTDRVTFAALLSRFAAALGPGPGVPRPHRG